MINIQTLRDYIKGYEIILASYESKQLTFSPHYHCYAVYVDGESVYDTESLAQAVEWYEGEQ